MEENGYIASIAASAFYLIVSARFIRLHRRTGERPELLIGIYFALSGLYYLGYNIPSLLRFDSWPPLVELAVEWTYVLGVFPYLLFIRLVFRAREAWAGWLVGVCSICLVLGTGLTTIHGSVDYSLDSPWFIIQWLGYTTPCLWLAWEALLYRRSARKRARIGLCLPIVANRYLLIGLFGILQVLACVADLSLANDLDEVQTVSLVTDALLGSAEITSVAVLWLAFLPPRRYVDWITQRAATLLTPMDG